MARYQQENRERIAQRRKERDQAHPGAKQRYQKEYDLKRLYGLSIGDYDVLMAQQGFSCAICRGRPTKPYSFHVDHDHDSGQVRGLLCGKCNPMLGLANDDPVRLRAGAEYLERWQ